MTLRTLKKETLKTHSNSHTHLAESSIIGQQVKLQGAASTVTSKFMK
jgi:hypothetical protein